MKMSITLLNEYGLLGTERDWAFVFLATKWGLRARAYEYQAGSAR